VLSILEILRYPDSLFALPNLFAHRLHGFHPAAGGNNIGVMFSQPDGYLASQAGSGSKDNSDAAR